MEGWKEISPAVSSATNPHALTSRDTLRLWARENHVMAASSTNGHRSIDGILFDFGGVVVDGPFEAFVEIEAKAGAATGLIRSINSRNPDTNAWAKLERGEIDVDEFVTMFEAEAAAFDASVDARAVLTSLLQMPATKHHARPVVLDAVRRYRDLGFRVGLLTNNVAPMTTALNGTSWVIDEFDVVVESCLSGMRKPEKAFYELACGVLGTPPHRTAFLDDLGINLKPAREFGMHTIKVIDAASAVAELDALIKEGSS
jgi:putative hydrolase of the HAD superfamily